MNYKGMKSVLLILFLVMLYGFTKSDNPTQKYKCVLQLSNYEGEGAYVVISLLKPNKTYAKTLYMFGSEPRWWMDIKVWWNFHREKENDLDGITGESIAGGERKIIILEIPKNKINQGYFLKFESAVEDLEYYEKDVMVPLDSKKLNTKFKGSGYIRYVRLIAKR